MSSAHTRRRSGQELAVVDPGLELLGVEGRNRVVIRGVGPEIDGGRWPAKRVVGESVVVEADVFTDGHDRISCEILWRWAGYGTAHESGWQGEPDLAVGPPDDPDAAAPARRSGRTSTPPAQSSSRQATSERSSAQRDEAWHSAPMEFLENDRWAASFTVTELGRYEFTVRGWVDHFKTWSEDLEKRLLAEQDIAVDLLIGARLVEEGVDSGSGPDVQRLAEYAKALSGDGTQEERAELALSEELQLLMLRHGPRKFVTTYHRKLGVVVDRHQAGFSSWYEIFPRSATPDPSRHGTLKDVETRLLPYVAALGFDVLYLPPIHPIGETARKGPNNVPTADPGDVGSPWAIGSRDGGHKSVHPELGTVEDLRHLAARAREYGIELALDIAFQCSPDHPYVREHPEWFRHRPDGTIQYAENPPKKYQDIYPFDFESEDWQGLWNELKSVVLFWVEQGVRIFRVDNPHTKPFPFWEWMINDVKREHPDVMFLAEAFTRPKVMYQLAKLGFTQSYTYFAWRNSKPELTEYFTELTRTEAVEVFRPNAWPNTPDILTEYLQFGGRPAFVNRLILAATLAANYGIYGPAFELQEHVAVRAGSEEYLHSEKYQIREWDLDRPDSLRDLIARVNRIRRENAALHADRRLHFHQIDNPQLVCYSKSTDDFGNVILCIVNVDPQWTQAGWTQLDLHDLGLEAGQAFQVHDLLTGARYRWEGSVNFVELDPQVVPAHVFRVRVHERTERDFLYYR